MDASDDVMAIACKIWTHLSKKEYNVRESYTCRADAQYDQDQFGGLGVRMVTNTDPCEIVLTVTAGHHTGAMFRN